MRSRWREKLIPNGLMPDAWRGANRDLALWQLPLILTFSIEPGPYVFLCWVVSWVLVALKRWWLIYPLMLASLAVIFMLKPPPSAEFFIGMLVLILPLSWRPEDGQVISPVGLPPTIFLVGSVFIFHIQFFILLLMFVWLLGFLMWFSMTYAGWSLNDLRIRWLRLLSLSLGASSLIVVIFALVPKIETGMIPSFARAQDKIQLTDELSADGFRSLLADDTVAFRAFPLDQIQDHTPYWRVFTLDQQTADGWLRSNRRPNDYARSGRLDLPHRQFDLLAEGHDLRWLPVPGWAAPGVLPRNRVTPWGEVASPANTLRNASVAFYDQMSPLTDDPRAWRETSRLMHRGRIAVWAREQRARFDSDRDFANFLVDHFRMNFRYSTETAYEAETSADALDQFFFEGREGYCSFFAQAMATAFRAAGIPANVVTGYLGGSWNEFGNYWIVRNNMAHAWVEARIDGVVWKRYDPTLLVAPAAFDAALSGGFSTQTLRFEGNGNDDRQRPSWLVQAGLWVDSLNTNITRSIMQYGGGQGRSLGSRITGMDFETLIWILGGMMLSIVTVSGSSVMIRRLGFIGNAPGIVLERQLREVLAAKGLPGQPGEGLLAHARRAAGELPQGDAGRLLDIAIVICAMRFGRRSTDRKSLRNIGRDIKGLKSSLQPSR